MQLQGTALDQYRLKSLNAEPVQRRGAVQQNRVLLDYIVQGVPDNVFLPVHHLLCTFNIVGRMILHKLLHYEGPEKLDGHFLRHAALVDLHLRSDNNNGTAGIVHALSKQVLAEASLFSLEHIRNGFQGTGIRTGHRPAASSVVNERIHGFLQHALFVADNDIRRVELHQTLQAVVPVDDAPVQIVQVGCREAAAVELHHRTKFRRNHGKHRNNHPFGTVSGSPERLYNLQALENLGLFLAVCLLQFILQLQRQLVAVNFAQQRLNGFRTHAGLEVVLIFFPHVPVFRFRQELFFLQRRAAGVGYDIACKIQHFFQLPGRHVQHKPHAARNALKVPDVRYRHGQGDMAHALAADLGLRDLDAAAVADFSLVADFLIFAAMALPVLCGAEDPFAEQTVPLRLECPVVDGFRLLHFAVGPFHNGFRGGNANSYRVKLCIIHISHPPRRQ